MTPEKLEKANEETNWLSWICDSKDTDELRNKYNTWAQSYESDVDSHWRFMTINVARTLEKVLPAKDASILDAGAGTGMVGEALAKLGYDQIVAADISEEMLNIAAQKQVYKALQHYDLQDSHSVFALESFDAIVAAGVFAYAHAGIDVLHNLIPLLKKEGLFVMTIRQEYYQQIQEGLQQLPWSLISQQQFPIYETEVMYILIFRKTSF